MPTQVRSKVSFAVVKKGGIKMTIVRLYTAVCGKIYVMAFQKYQFLFLLLGIPMPTHVRSKNNFVAVKKGGLKMKIKKLYTAGSDNIYITAFFKSDLKITIRFLQISFHIVTRFKAATSYKSFERCSPIHQLNVVPKIRAPAKVVRMQTYSRYHK